MNKTPTYLLAALGFMTMLHTGLVFAEKGPDMAVYAPDKNTIVIDEQWSGGGLYKGAYTNTLLYSTDYGKTWGRSINPTPDNTSNYCGPSTKSHDIFAIKYLGPEKHQRFMSVNASVTGGIICSSMDGVSWTMDLPDNTHPDKDPNRSSWPFYDITYGDGAGTYVAVGAFGTARYSTDGQNWNIINYDFGDSNSLNSVTYGLGMFIVASDGSHIWYSRNGIDNWTPCTIDISGSAAIYRVLFAPDANGGKGQFVAVGSDATIWSSDNGIDWNVANLSGLTNKRDYEARFTDVVYGNGTYVAIGDDDTAATSTDGSTFTMNDDAFYVDGIYNRPKSVVFNVGRDNIGRFVVVTANYTGINDGFIFASEDGVTWQQQGIYDQNNNPASEIELAAIIPVGNGELLGVPYGSGQTSPVAPYTKAYIIRSKAGENWIWQTVCDLGFTCFNNQSTHQSQHKGTPKK